MHATRDVIRSTVPPLLAATVVALLVGLPPEDAPTGQAPTGITEVTP